MKKYLMNLIRKIHITKLALDNRKILKNIFVSLGIMFLIVLLIPNIPAKAASKIPNPTALKYVNDYVGVVDSNDAQYIVSVGKELEDKTGAQATVVIINSLGGTDIESYANEFFRSWGIGQKDKNNGLLILLAIKDKKWRVEVGTGLEGAVTDIYSSRVMNDFAVPKFKENKYGEGLREVYSVLADSIAKEYEIKLDKNINVPKQNISNKNANKINIQDRFVLIPILILLLFDFIFNRGRLTRFILELLFWSSIGRRGGRNGGGKGGGGFGGFGGGSSSGGGSSGDW